MLNKKPVVLVICDGLGLDNKSDGNAWSLAHTPNFDNLLNNYPTSLIKASGAFVGLPDGQIGNSEVGHLNIGAGRIVFTGLPLVNDSVKTKQIFKNQKFIDTFNTVKERNSTLHIMGLLSPGGVHSHEKHLFAILEFAKLQGIKKVYLHAFGDGRDVKPKSIIPSIEKVDKLLKNYGYSWGSISGRYYAMDRDSNFDRNIKAYKAICNDGVSTFTNPVEFINNQYKKDILDEFLTPTSAVNNPGIQQDDVVIFFNFRPDRARQLSHLLIGSKLYDYPFVNKNIYLLSLMKYPAIDCHVAFAEMIVNNPLGQVLETNKLSQLRIAETEKYAHVTFFMDGGKELEFKNEKKILVPSKKVASFDLTPEMSAKEIVDQLIGNLKNYDVTICNFANADMVGHTGMLSPAIKAMEALDEEVGRLVKYIESINAVMFLTADHGNVEVMKDEQGNPATKHTTNLVPLISTDKSIQLKDGALADIAPTILDYIGISAPTEMTHKSLLIKKENK